MKLDKKLVKKLSEEYQSYDWFHTLEKEDQEWVIEEAVKFEMPIDDVNDVMNTLMINALGKKQDWLNHRLAKFPWLSADTRDSQQARREKRAYLSGILDYDAMKFLGFTDEQR